MQGRLALAIVVVVIVVGASAGALLAHRRGGGATGPATAASTSSATPGSVELGLHAGDVLEYNISWAIWSPVNGTLNLTRASYVERIEVTGFSGDYLLSANLTSGGKSSTGSVPYGLLAIPKAYLGAGDVVVPVVTPLGGVCLKLSLTGRTTWRGWGAVVYEGEARGPGYEVSFRGVYNESNGVALEVNTTASLHSGNLTSRISLKLALEDYKPSQGALLQEKLSPSSFCEPLVSSDLRLCADGFYLLGSHSLSPVSLGELENATKGPSVVVILNKYCPHCQRFWPNLLEARGMVRARIYAVIFSGSMGLSNPMMEEAINYVASAAGLNAAGGLPTPSIIVFPGGGASPAYRAGEMSASEFAEWVNTVLKGR